jgi:hypothetical protein
MNWNKKKNKKKKPVCLDNNLNRSKQKHLHKSFNTPLSPMQKDFFLSLYTHTFREGNRNGNIHYNANMAWEKRDER